jgi:hypothetical protein
MKSLLFAAIAAAIVGLGCLLDDRGREQVNAAQNWAHVDRFDQGSEDGKRMLNDNPLRSINLRTYR